MTREVASFGSIGFMQIKSNYRKTIGKKSSKYLSGYCWDGELYICIFTLKMDMYYFYHQKKNAFVLFLNI